MTYASLGLRVGTPDPAAGFPGGTKFMPYAALRNATEKLLKVSATLNYMAGGKPVAVSPPGLQLKPFESRQVDFPALLTSVGLGSFRGDLNLALRFTGHQGDLVLATGSVDQMGTYVFGVLPEGVAKSRSKESAFWTVVGGFDSTFTLWNPTGAAEDVLVTLYYADGSGHYQVPVHLEAQASATLDMAVLMAAQQPDAEGHVIPATVQSGSVVVASGQGEAQPVTVVLSEAVFNVLTATCANCCFTCNGTSFITVTANPFSGTIGVLLQLTATATWNTGMTTNETVNATWSSNATAVATVQTTGQTSPGLVSGVAPGSCTITALLMSADLPGRECPDLGTFCPFGNVSGSSSGNVDTLVFTVASNGVPNDAAGVIAKTPFILKIQAKSPTGVVPDTSFNAQNVPFTLTNMNTTVGEAVSSSTVSFTSGETDPTVTIVQASGLTDSVRQIVVGANATGTVFFPFVYMNVFATDEGNVGKVTACQYTIPANAQFVALPYSGNPDPLCGVQVLVVNGSAHQQVPVEEAGPWCPHSVATTSNPCVCPNDNYWQGTAVPFAATNSCSSNGAGIDLGDGTYATVRGGTNGPVDWKFP